MSELVTIPLLLSELATITLPMPHMAELATLPIPHMAELVTIPLFLSELATITLLLSQLAELLIITSLLISELATTSLLVSQLAELAPPLTRLLTTEIALCQQCMLELTTPIKFPTLPNMYVVQKLELQVVKLIRAK